MTDTATSDERVARAAFMIGIPSDDTETMALLRSCDGYAGILIEAVGRVLRGRPDAASEGDPEIEDARTQMIGSIYRAFVWAGWGGEGVPAFEGPFAPGRRPVAWRYETEEAVAFDFASEFVSELEDVTGFEEGDFGELAEHLSERSVIAFRTDEMVAAMRH